MPSHLPLFPLGVVLYPGAVVPLHIFEPRYRQLVIDCVSEDDRFGMCPPAEGRGAPAIGAIGCLAEIVERETLSDGRSNLLVLGRERFRIMRLVEEGTPYYLGDVDLFDDDPATLPDAGTMRALKDLAGQYIELARLLTEEPLRELPFDDDPVVATFEIAAMLEVDFQLRQRMLVMRDTGERAALLLDMLPQILPQLAAALAVRRRARSNGTDAVDPDPDAEPSDDDTATA